VLLLPTQNGKRNNINIFCVAERCWWQAERSTLLQWSSRDSVVSFRSALLSCVCYFHTMSFYDRLSP